jgi:predicted aminopeptidase
VLRRVFRWLAWTLGALVVLGVLAFVVSPDVRYLVRAAVEEARILRLRRPIAEIVADPTAAAEMRADLRLVLGARDYAARLGLEAKETFTAFTDVGRDTLLLVLSAAPRDCICPYTWWYPVVGRVPYKGFFDDRMARLAADELAAEGYDVNLRPAGAFSTLGWFNDPLLSTAMSRDSVELAALVFHEIAHNTLWVPGAVAFNESYAQYVGYHAAAEFFRERGDTALARRALDRWHDERVLADYYEALVGRLERLYAMGLDSAAVDSGRAAEARWARAQLEGPIAAQVRTFSIGRLGDRPINNARLIGVRLYRTKLDRFERWHERHGGDVARAVAALDSLLDDAPGDADSAFARIERAVAAAAHAGP